MKKSINLAHKAITGALLLTALGISASYAADQDQEQCAGVIKAGKNDCATNANACHGHVEQDAAPMAWIYLPKGTCTKIAGAHLVNVSDPTPKK